MNSYNMQGGGAAAAAPHVNDFKTDTSTEEQLQAKAPANRGTTETQSQRPPSLRYERRGRNVLWYVLCTTYYVLCTMYYVLCTMYYVLCTVYYILYTICYILYIIYYILYTIYYIR